MLGVTLPCIFSRTAFFWSVRAQIVCCVLGEAPQTVLCPSIAASPPLLGKYCLRHVLLFSEWLKIYFLCTSIIFCIFQLIWLLTKLALILYISTQKLSLLTRIVYYFWLLRTSLKCFFPHLFRSKVLPSKIFPCWEYIHWDNFCIFDLDLFQSSSTVKSSSSSVQVNLLNLTVCPLLVFVILSMETETVAELLNCPVQFSMTSSFKVSSLRTNLRLSLFVSVTTEKESGSYHTHG